ncbi:MAG TPA: MBOAT family protein, partial [Euzebyales bacterium]|nr:MBOAT family protein [Euzebyales bacterium]
MRTRAPVRPVIAVPAVAAGGVVTWAAWGGVGWRLLAGTVGVYLCAKAAAILGPERAGLRAMSWHRRIRYLIVWPGFVSRPLWDRRPDDAGVGERWIRSGMPWILVGVVVLSALALSSATGEVAAWSAIAGLLATVHLGAMDVLSGLMRRLGHPVARAFTAPWAATSLGDFWTRRWNRPFVEMDRVVFLPLLAWLPPRTARFGVFLISGVLHELAISFPAGAGWGLPLAYFTGHALLVGVERTVRIDRWPVGVARMWTW